MRKGKAMGSPRFLWAVTVAVIPLVAPPAALAQSSSGTRSTELGRDGPPSSNINEPAPRKAPRRGRSRTVQQTHEDALPATNDWNPHYLKGKAYFIEGHYDEALTELEQNVADCDRIDFEAMRRQNGYFDHIWNSIPWYGSKAARVHPGRATCNGWEPPWPRRDITSRRRRGSARWRVTPQQCFPGRLSTFEGCACQGLAFLLAARGRYNQAADRYRLALAHIEGNEAQIGLPPAPCVAMILVALADVELARGRPGVAQQ